MSNYVKKALWDLTSKLIEGVTLITYVPQNPDKDLRILNRIIMTPHIGSSTVEACERMAKSVLQNIIHIINNAFEKPS